MSKLLTPINKQFTVKLRTYKLAYSFPCPECGQETLLMTRVIEKHITKEETMLCPECARKNFIKLLIDTTPSS